MTAARVTLPTRSLIDQQRAHQYTPAVKTDVRRTIRKFRLLQRMQAAAVALPTQPDLPNLKPPVALPVEVLMHLPARRVRVIT